ncbi:cytochrome P450 27C1-like [Dendronephthya gigantea]|uniref:cytochrome P450 27C1-like n=1 Tax=Dendronephthya gigantea TaxID=151771 RepID=UPI0010691DF7|nr:cytochrome P450 27C1-like [Dendronephthya gigantea]
MDIVNINDVDSLAKVLKTEENFQMRSGLDPVMEVFGRNVSGVISCDYNEWYPDRSLLSPMFLRPKEINERISMINAVANDCVERLHQLRDQDGTINNIERELSYWSVGSNYSFLFNRRLGFYEKPPDADALVFLDAASQLMQNIGRILDMGPFYKYIPTPAYYAAKRNINTMYESNIKLSKKREAKSEEDASEKTSVADHVFEKRKSTEETLALLAGLMAAGVDTISWTSLWLLYLLSRNPDKQEKLYQELKLFDSEEEIPVNKTPSYIKAALKESQRLHPVAPFLSRVLNQDIELHGYHIPAGVSIMFQNHLMSIDERNFGEDAKQFVPERWLRDVSTGRVKGFDPLSSLPFGHGVRMCLGRRVAEAYIYTLMSKIFMKYRVELSSKQNEVNPTLKGAFNRPDREILFRFLLR